MSINSVIVNIFMLVATAETGTQNLCAHDESASLEKKRKNKAINAGKALEKHRDRCFVNYLITSLVKGFLARLIWLPNRLLFATIYNPL